MTTIARLLLAVNKYFISLPETLPTTSRAPTLQWKNPLHYKTFAERLNVWREHRGVENGCTVDRIVDDFVRARLDPGEALLGHGAKQGHLVQPAAQDLRLAPEAAVLLHQGRS